MQSVSVVLFCTKGTTFFVKKNQVQMRINMKTTLCTAAVIAAGIIKRHSVQEKLRNPGQYQ